MAYTYLMSTRNDYTLAAEMKFHLRIRDDRLCELHISHRDDYTDARTECCFVIPLCSQKIRVTNHAVSANYVMSDSARLLSSHDRHQSRAQLPVGAPRIRYYMDHTSRLIRTILSQISVLKIICYTLTLNPVSLR